MKLSIASDERWPATGSEDPAQLDGSINRWVQDKPARRSRLTLGGLLKDLVLGVFVVLAAVLAILAIGTPIALFVRLLIRVVE